MQSSSPVAAGQDVSTPATRRSTVSRWSTNRYRPQCTQSHRQLDNNIAQGKANKNKSLGWKEIQGLEMRVRVICRVVENEVPCLMVEEQGSTSGLGRHLRANILAIFGTFVTSGRVVSG